MKLIPALIASLISVTVHASELRVEDEPEKTKEYKAGGIATKTTSSKRQTFSREGKKVASIIEGTDTLQVKDLKTQLPPLRWRIVQFLIGDDGWVEVGLDNIRSITSHFSIPVFVSAAETSVTVSAPSIGYYELFYVKENKFLDGTNRDLILRNGVLESDASILPH